MLLGNGPLSVLSCRTAGQFLFTQDSLLAPLVGPQDQTDAFHPIARDSGSMISRTLSIFCKH